MVLSDLTIKDASNQGAANTVPFPHFPRSKGEHLPCSHSQIQTSHLGPGLRSICQKLQDPSTENEVKHIQLSFGNFSEKAVAVF